MSTVAGGSPAGAASSPARGAERAIGGMTCASCAARIEKKLNKLDGVTATVNFATETAQVAFPATLSTGDLISVVEQAGYTAAVTAPPGAGPDETAGGEDAREAASLRRRRGGARAEG